VVPGFVDDAFCVKVGFSFAVAVEAASYHRVPPCTKRERENERERERERERKAEERKRSIPSIIASQPQHKKLTVCERLSVTVFVCVYACSLSLSLSLSLSEYED
jgi:hypothetical protein